MSAGPPTPDSGSPLYSGIVVTMVLWYTASGTFTWSRSAGCTLAPPERRLAAPWGPKLS